MTKLKSVSVGDDSVLSVVTRFSHTRMCQSYSVKTAKVLYDKSITGEVIPDWPSWSLKWARNGTEPGKKETVGSLC